MICTGCGSAADILAEFRRYYEVEGLAPDEVEAVTSTAKKRHQQDCIRGGCTCQHRVTW